MGYRLRFGKKKNRKYELVEKIGDGGYSDVFLAITISSGTSKQLVAVKKLKSKYQSVTGEEVEIQMSLHHPNVVQVLEVASGARVSSGRCTEMKHNKGGGSYIVLEYVPYNLSNMFLTSLEQVRKLIKQLIMALAYCHDNKIIHMDIKPENILLDCSGNLKLADFGLAYRIKDLDNMWPKAETVCSFPYRSPQLLLGTTKYGTEVDIWSAGCVFAELLLNTYRQQSQPNTRNWVYLFYDDFKTYPFPMEQKKEALGKMFKMCGFPPDSTTRLPKFLCYFPGGPEKHGHIGVENTLKTVYPAIDLDPNAISLLERMLEIDPARRISAKDALNSEYLKTA